MGKKFNIEKFILNLVALFTSVGVGILFIDGTFLDAMILGSFPDFIHQIVGWVAVGGGVWNFINSFK